MALDWDSVSDALLVAAIVAYVVAMALHAGEVVVPSLSRVPVTAGGTPTDGGRPNTADTTPDGAPFGRAAVAVTVLAALAHLACVLARAVEVGRVPWANLYEFLLVTTLVGVVAWLVVLRRSARVIGLFVTLTVVLLLGAAGRVHVRSERELMPALESPWLRVHVAAAALAAGLFLTGFVVTVLYLLRRRHDDSDQPAGLGASLPPADRLDRLAARLHTVAFPVWTFAIISGAIWAESAWGRYWGWDPKETWVFISWVLYAAYLHARTTAGWRGRTAALLVCVAWASMLINIFAVNLLTSGLHSYAGL